MKCNYCGRESTYKHKVFKRIEYGEYLCWNCYMHYKEHPVNPIPSKGVMGYDADGRVICHICGRAYDRLTTHLKYKHGISKDEYKEEFGINRTQKLTSESHSANIRNACANTLLTSEGRKSLQNVRGPKHPRYGKKNRLQTTLNLKRSKVSTD